MYLQDLLSPGDRRRSQKRICGVVDSTILPRSPRQGVNDVSETKRFDRMGKQGEVRNISEAS